MYHIALIRYTLDLRINHTFLSNVKGGMFCIHLKRVTKSKTRYLPTTFPPFTPTSLTTKHLPASSWTFKKSPHFSPKDFYTQPDSQRHGDYFSLQCIYSLAEAIGQPAAPFLRTSKLITDGIHLISSLRERTAPYIFSYLIFSHKSTQEEQWRVKVACLSPKYS